MKQKALVWFFVIITIIVLLVGGGAWWYFKLRKSIEPKSSSGQTCGGIAGLQCPDGYTCQYTEESKKIVDAAGTCVKK